MKQTSDILILGAGIVGLTTALQLAKQGLSVCVFDKTMPQIQNDLTQTDARVFAVMPKTQRFFAELNLWDAMVQQRVSPYRSMQVWDQQPDKNIYFSANEIGQPYLGHIIEQKVILNVLIQACAQSSKIKIFAPVELIAVKTENNSVSIQTSSGDYCGKLLLGADGPQSWLREHSQFDVIKWDYIQDAIVATVTTELSHQQCARQCFTPTGPVALLPLADPNSCSIVWSQDREKAQKLMQLSDDDFMQQLQSAFGNTLGNIKLISKRYSYPLQMRHVKNYVKPRIALLGDAAHTLHPLAGVGMNLGLLDSYVLCETIANAQQNEKDFGAYHHLRPFERARKGHNWLMIAVMESFKRLFATELTPMVQIRRWGLKRVDALQTVKNQIMQSFL